VIGFYIVREQSRIQLISSAMYNVPAMAYRYRPGGRGWQMAISFEGSPDDMKKKCLRSKKPYFFV